MQRGWRWRALRVGATRRAAIALLLITGCAYANGISVRDDAGHMVELRAPAQRVISLAPHLTELVFAAGAGDKLVGVMRYSDHPPAAQTLPVIGDAFALNYEAIALAKPDLVLVWGSGLNDRHKTRLRALGLPLFESEVSDVDGIARTLRTLGRLLGTEATAEPEAERLLRDWRALVAAHAGRTPVRVFYQLWSQPLMTINREHVIDAALRACGGVNAFAHLPALTPTVSWEAAVQSNPQIVIGAGGSGGRFEPGRWSQFKQVDAVRRGRFATVDGALVSRMGPRYVDAARQLCDAVDQARR